MQTIFQLAKQANRRQIYLSVLGQSEFRQFGKLTCAKRFRVLSEDFLTDLTDALDETDSNVFEEVNYADGVLNIEMSDSRCYVLNKQQPNMQIWLSSPISGP